MKSPNQQHREVQEIFERLARAERRCEPRAEEYTNVYPPSTNITMAAGEIYVAPIFPPCMFVRAIYATIANAAGNNSFAIALYKVHSSFLERDVELDALHNIGNKITFRRIAVAGTPRSFRTDSSSGRRFLTVLEKEHLLDPRLGYFAIAYQGESADCLILGPTTNTSQYSGYTTGVRTFGDFPEYLTGVAAAAGVAVPSFTLRTSKAMRIIGR